MFIFMIIRFKQSIEELMKCSLNTIDWQEHEQYEMKISMYGAFMRHVTLSALRSPTNLLLKVWPQAGFMTWLREATVCEHN